MNHFPPVPSVHEILHAAINSTEFDVDIRRSLYGNIICAGGSSMFKGLPERLAKEMEALATAPTIEGEGAFRVRVIAPPERKYSAWIGGSILSSLESFGTDYNESFQSGWVTKAEYDDVGPSIVHRKCS